MTRRPLLGTLVLPVVLVLVAGSAALGGIAAGRSLQAPLQSNAVLLDGTPCTVARDGERGGTCYGAFVEAVPTPAPTPAPTPPPPITYPADPIGWIDVPTANESVSGVLQTAGWAIDRNATGSTSGVDGVALYLDGPPGVGTFLGTPTYPLPRPDVGAYFGHPRWNDSGWSFDWTVGSLSPGPHTLYLAMHSSVSGATTGVSQSVTVPGATPTPVVLVGAGDIASCARSEDEQTARLLDAIPGIVFTAGDNAYDNGSAGEFASCYDPSWGRHRARTRPATGNHDYHTPGAWAYFDYFGEAAAGPRDRGYYSYEAGAWHVVVLNSNCGDVGGCAAGSPQELWLRADLAAHPARCTAAIWHHATFSSGSHGSDPATFAFWVALYEAGAEVVIVGHDHHYERFAPQSPDGRRDDATGIRQFVVGTGGKDLRSVGPPIANSEVGRDDTHGVLELTLRDEGYDWRFVPVAGASFTDQGSAACH